MGILNTRVRFGLDRFHCINKLWEYIFVSNFIMLIIY